MNLWLTHRSYYTQLRQLWNKAWKKKFRPELDQTYALCETIRTFVVGCADGMTCFTTTIKMMSVTVFAKELTMTQIKWDDGEGSDQDSMVVWNPDRPSDDTRETSYHCRDDVPCCRDRTTITFGTKVARTCSGIPRTNYNHLSGHLLWWEVSNFLDGVGLT